ncbi:MAG: phage integrase Arm DNA-binding domain-containing protein [Pseudomonadaceae bacterium]|nr:phage integrase Arm DNA-binding domain-containing protein [Pseudomonadaceae bacterium]
MSPRPRSQGSKDMPPNLYRKTDKRNGVTYYSYKDVVSGRMLGLGTDKAQALREALAANAALSVRPTIQDRLGAKPVRPFSLWLARYREIFAERELAASTTRNVGMRINRLEALFGALEISEISTLKIADYLTSMAKQGKAQMSRAMRSLLSDIFMEAMAAGWVSTNPVDVTKAARIKIKRERLTLEIWRAAYAEAKQPWLKRAMELAVLTGQRRDDIASMLFKDYSDGHLHVIQSKTGQRLRLSGAIKLESLGLDLESTVKRCRDRVVSQNLVHHSRQVSRAMPGQPLMLDTLSSTFAAAVKKAMASLGIELDGTPPTFHEQRSLAARLHAAEGRDPQALLGHKSAKMTDIYRDVRGAEWIDVA